MSLFTSLLTAGTNSHQETSENANALGTDFLTAGVTGTITLSNGTTSGTGSFAVNAQGSPNMTVAVATGTAWLFATPSGQNSQALRVKNSTSANVTISANSSGSTKYDWVYISVDAAKAANPAVDASDVATLVTSRSSSNTTDNGTPPTYGYCLAVVTVANGASSITQGNISDKRGNAVLSSAGVSQSTSWNSLGLTPNSITALGNRSYAMVYNNVDLTGTLSAGMRKRTTRTVQAPTQCTSLNGSTQFYSKTSPAGMTGTNNYVAGGWFKITAYGAQGLISKWTSASGGWRLLLNASGQIQMDGFNGGNVNSKTLTSYQSVPLNKWFHVAAQLDMTVTTNTSTTNYVMIDGVDVPAVVTTGGTNPTAWTNSGVLEVGAQNGGQTPLIGKAAQVFVYGAKVTQATILASMHQTLAGTETSLISAYSFNNTINDLNTTNANNLTANGSAVATNADSPFGGQADGTISSTLDYAIIQKVAFSTNTTVTVQVPEGCTIPTSGGVSAVVYSSNDSPYGFPKQKAKWEIICKTKTNPNASNTTAAQFSGMQVIAPTGEWEAELTAGLLAVGTAAGQVGTLGLSTSSSSYSDDDLQATVTTQVNSVIIYNSFTRTKQLSVASPTTYYLVDSVSTASLTLNVNSQTCVITFRNAYL